MRTEDVRPRRRPLAGLAVLAGLGALGGWLWHLGTGPLAPPALDRPGDWARWVDEVGAVTAAFGILRLLCLAATAYLALCLVVGIVAGRSGRASLRRVADLVCLPPVRRLLEGVLGVGIGVGALTATVVPVAAAGASPSGVGSGRAVVTLTMAAVPAATGRLAVAVPTMRALVAPPAMVAVPHLSMRAVDAGAAASVTPTMILRAVEAPTSSAASPATPAATQPPGLPTASDLATEVPAAQTSAPEGTAAPDPAPEGEAAPGRAVGDGHVVEAGDHFWRIAEHTVTAALGREPTEDEVGTYWQRLVDANAERLTDPTNPDLLFTGQALVLPTP